MRLRYSIILLIIAILITITVSLGSSYAFWYYGSTQGESNNVVVGCFNVTFKDRFDENDAIRSRDINLLNTYPVSDEKGISFMSVPYTIVIKNVCDVDSNYDVYLEQLESGGVDISSDYLRLELNNNSYNLTDFESSDPLINGIESRRLYTGRLNSNESKMFRFRMWIKYSATIKDVANTIYNGKVVIVNVPTIEEGNSYGNVVLN